MIVFGTKKKTEVAGFGVGRACMACGNRVYGVLQQTKKFSLYFVPVFTYGKDMTAICTNCGFTSSDGSALTQNASLYATEYAASLSLEQANAELR
jgi:hypothetical protein